MRRLISAAAAAVLLLSGGLRAAPADSGPLATDTGPTLATHHPTYNGDVARIVDDHCVTCHRDGGIAPFKLSDYRTVRRHINDIVKATQRHDMPPWKPLIGFSRFQDERHLADADIATLAQWAREGAPEGTEPRPTPPVFSSSVWRLGTPDYVFKVGKPFHVTPENTDTYRCFVFPLPFDKDTAIDGVEFDPGNSAVLHHSFFFLDSTGLARQECKGTLDEGYDPLMMGSLWDGTTRPKKAPKASASSAPDGQSVSDDPMSGLGSTESLGGWAPGATPHRMAPGVAYVIRKGTDLVLQAHFRSDGKEELVQPRIALYLSHSPVRTELRHLTLATRPLNIPPYNSRVEVHDRITLPVPITIHAIAPHAHLLCRRIQVVATLPGGNLVPLIWIPHWDFNWQGQYWFEEPVRLPAGSRIDTSFIYDNSTKNPNNPNKPPVAVHSGWHTSDEMMHVFLTISTDSDRQYNRLRRHVTSRGNHGSSQKRSAKGEQGNQVLSVLLAVLGLIGVVWLGAAVRNQYVARKSPTAPGPSDAA